MYIATKYPSVFSLQMVEPASAAIAAYLVTEGPKIAQRFSIPRCVRCLRRNRSEILSALCDEASSSVLDQFNRLLHYHDHCGYVIFVVVVLVFLVLC